MGKPKNLCLGFLASHNGSSMKAIIQASQKNELLITPALVISNNSDSGALVYAKLAKIPNFHLSKSTQGNEALLDQAICQKLQEAGVDLVVLSGWMSLLGPKTLAKYEGKILNSHPALLSSPYKGKGFYGDIVHTAVLKAKEKQTGVTIHLVDNLYDHGRILGETKVLVLKNDTVDTLRDRVQKQERRLYIEVLKQISQGEIIL